MGWTARGFCLALVGLTLAFWRSAGAGPPAPRVPGGSEGEAFSRPRPALNLERLRTGEYRYTDASGAFSALIGTDGNVEFKDRRAKLGNYELDVVGHKLGLNTVPEPSPQVSRLEHESRKQMMPPQPYGDAPILVGIGFRFGGLYDMFARNKGAAAKQTFMKRTEGLRSRLAIEHESRRLVAALYRLQDDMRTLWDARGLSLAEKRRALFHRWDECAIVEDRPVANVRDDDAERLQAARVKAGEEARRRSEQFIAVHAGPTSPARYSQRELRAFNRQRRSAQPFAPYARPDRALPLAPRGRTDDRAPVPRPHPPEHGMPAAPPMQP